MTITIDITQTVAVGQNATTNVNVSGLTATSDEIPFAADLTKVIVDFTENYYNRGGKKETSA